MATIKAPLFDAPVFEQFRSAAWPYKFFGQMRITNAILGGVPSDPKVAEGWLKTKVYADKEAPLQEAIAQVMLERGITDPTEAIEAVNELKNLNGFKRDEDGVYIEGRQLKAGIKEAASVALAAGMLAPRGWGTTNKGILSFMAEHVFVTEDRLHLLTQDGKNIMTPTDILQSFVHTWRGTGIQYTERVEGPVLIDFTIISDWDFSEEEWAMIWLKGEQQGIGASRSQGYGRYELTRWEQFGRPQGPSVAAKKAAKKTEKVEKAAS